MISKEDIIKAFKNNKGKRNRLLYEFYKETYFSKDLPAQFIAEKLSDDLGIRITPGMIYLINHRIAKKSTTKKSPNEQKPETGFEPIAKSPGTKFTDIEQTPSMNPYKDLEI